MTTNVAVSPMVTVWFRGGVMTNAMVGLESPLELPEPGAVAIPQPVKQNKAMIRLALTNG